MPSRHAFGLRQGAFDVVKEADPAAEKHRDEMQDEFVEQPFLQGLLHPGRAHDGHVLATGGCTGPGDSLRDAVSDKGVRRIAGRDLAGDTVGEDKQRGAGAAALLPCRGAGHGGRPARRCSRRGRLSVRR